MRPVLDRDPIASSAAFVTALAVLRHDTFNAHPTCSLGQIGADLATHERVHARRYVVGSPARGEGDDASRVALARACAIATSWSNEIGRSGFGPSRHWHVAKPNGMMARCRGDGTPGRLDQRPHDRRRRLGRPLQPLLRAGHDLVSSAAVCPVVCCQLCHGPGHASARHVPVLQPPQPSTS